MSYVRPKPQEAQTALRIGIWIGQVLACMAFGAVGLIKLLKPIPELSAMWPWTGTLPTGIVRGLGIIDIAGAVGVLLPSLTRIVPRLTVVAAACCIVLQICAIVFHVSRGEIALTPVNVVFLALVAFVFWGRRKVPILSR